ncbi:ferredoxin-type protein NapF [Motiliproteus sp.]|uniref:ferredoxin-type protein NapF n=1 Tax=Motiliproteus sp. TaxID=1898955 RepID=UPI003BA8E38D
MAQAAFNPSRRQLLRGDTGSKRLPLRPPWSVEELAFINDCSRCGDCIQSCPEQILFKGSGGFPEVDFSRGECTFCEDCVRVCKAPVFHSTDHDPWNLKAHISQSCVTYKQVVCRSCAEQCEPEAITLKPQLGGIATPKLDLSACTGCGACVAVCPTKAINVHQPLVQDAQSMTANNDKEAEQ